MAETFTGISGSPLDVAGAIGGATSPLTGGIGAFVGTVRRTASAPGFSDQEVVALEYDVHPDLAESALDEIATEAADRWDLARVVAIHRSGRCDLGEPTVVIACSAPHRAEALDATRWIIDAIKTRVPIWKREVYDDGSQWVTEGA